MYRRHRRQKADGLGRRVCASSSSGPVITGPMYFAMAAQGVQKKAVAFALPNRYVEKANLGTRRNPRSKNEARNVVHVDDQCRFQVGIGYVAARQRAIDLAMAIDEECVESGIHRSLTGVASWGDDRRSPLYWVGSDPGMRGPVLMYECRHFFEEDCEQLPISLGLIYGVLVNAHKVYINSLPIRFHSFEHVGSPQEPSFFIDDRTVKVATSSTVASDARVGDDDWMEGLSVADALKQFGVDAKAVFVLRWCVPITGRLGV